MTNISKREPAPFRDSHHYRFAEPGSQRHQREKSNRFSTPSVQRVHGTDLFVVHSLKQQVVR